MICDPLHKLDCCLVTDGGGAIIVTGNARARATRPSAPFACSAPVRATRSGTWRSMPDLTVHARRGIGTRGVRNGWDQARRGRCVRAVRLRSRSGALELEDLGFCGKARREISSKADASRRAARSRQ